MIYQNLIVTPKISTSRILFYNCITSLKNNTISYVANKYILPSIQWMHYTTNTINPECSDMTKGSNNQNLPVCFPAKNVDTELKDTILQDSTSNRTNNDLYLNNPEVAKKFVTLIKDDLLKNMSHVIELNPGLGYLTEQLFQIGVPFVHLYESKHEYQNLQNNMYMKFPNRFSFSKLNLFNISKMLNHASTDNKHVYKLLNSTQHKRWEEESCMQIIGTTTKYVFIRHLIISTLFQTSFMMFGRPIFYLAIPPSMYDKLTHVKRATSMYTMFNILFNYEMFGTVDRRAFIPKYKNNKAKTVKVMTNDNNVLNVVKIEPKPELFALFKTKKNLIYFWHFVRHNLYKPTSRVIPTLEKIIPGCGVKLIALNYNIFTEFGDLNPKQIYDLFMEFQSWPEFEQSSFVLSANDIKKTHHLYLEEEDIETQLN